MQKVLEMYFGSSFAVKIIAMFYEAGEIPVCLKEIQHFPYDFSVCNHINYCSVTKNCSAVSADILEIPF